MSKGKKRKNNNDVKTVSLDTKNLEKYKNKYIGIIKEVVENENDINQMMSAVALINSQLLLLATKNPEDIPEEKQEEIIEVYHYAVDRMMTSTSNEEKILENWFGDYPLLFRMGDTFVIRKEIKEMENYVSNLSKGKQDLFQKIVDKIWNTRKKRTLVVDDDLIKIPKTIPKEYLEENKNLIRVLVSHFFKYGCVLIFSQEDKEKIVKMGMKKSKNGKIEIIDKKELQWAYSHGLNAIHKPQKPEIYQNFNL